MTLSVTLRSLYALVSHLCLTGLRKDLTRKAKAKATAFKAKVKT